MEYRDISYNFSVAKVLSILMVATGHFFSGTILWIPTTVALFIFAFSSGYFSAAKYVGAFSVRKFWRAKIVRLGYSLAVIDLFLLMLFLFEGRGGIFSWKTLVAMAGLNAVLPWMGIPYRGPFGYGLWFLTVLWLFYLAYPVIERINRERLRAVLFIGLMLAVTTGLNFTVLVGYELWLTVFGFLFGCFVAGTPARLPFSWAFGLLAGCVAAMLALNGFWHVHAFNYFLILAASVAVCAVLLAKRLPDRLSPFATLLSGCVMEIYLIHSYLFVHFRIPVILDYLVSIALIVLVAKALAALRDGLRSAQTA